MGNKYYAVAVGRKPGLYKTWDECKEQTNGFSDAKFKSFQTESEARKYLQLNDVAIDKKGNVVQQRAIKNCLLCLKPMRKKGELCFECINKRKKIEEILFVHSQGRITEISTRTLVFLKQKNQVDDIFSLLEKNPNLYWTAFKTSKDVRGKIKREYKQHIAETEEYEIGGKMPDFVYSMLGSTKEPIKVYGDRKNPFILYRCKKCGETLFTKYRDYLVTSGHDCDGIKSSGEIIVEDFLKEKGIKYKTQRKTLKCINPDTGHVMPYDFELIGKKVLIEIQGDQHKSFIPRFHVTQEGFEYQKQKDEYKRNFAIRNGYIFVEIWYDELKDETFKNKILDII